MCGSGVSGAARMQAAKQFPVLQERPFAVIFMIELSLPLFLYIWDQFTEEQTQFLCVPTNTYIHHMMACGGGWAVREERLLALDCASLCVCLCVWGHVNLAETWDETTFANSIVSWRLCIAVQACQRRLHRLQAKCTETQLLVGYRRRRGRMLSLTILSL